ncbi:MAG: DUF4982 domain-containing protein [Clostridia bacterium]|nr:DUF4982 domain-containing protein [Clostridia bacterium]
MSRVLLDADWRFFEGDFEQNTMHKGYTKAGEWGFGFSAAGFDDSCWEEIDIPHDFAVKKKPEPFNRTQTKRDDSLRVAVGSKVGGVAWYRKKLIMDKPKPDERIFIEFDGVYRNSRVYVNEFYIGSNLSGYIGFEFDITDFLHEGENIIAVRCDASEAEGWWYQGGGIFRHVWLKTEKDVFVSDVYAKSKTAGNKGFFEIETEIKNKSAGLYEGTLRVDVISPAGEVLTADSSVSVGSYKNILTTIKISVNNPMLWSCENPNLYTVKAYIDNGSEYILTTGIRDVYFDENKGFFLNGKSVKIKGVCMHQDHAGLGTGLFDGIYDFKIRKLKEMGCNAVRMSHNPCSREFLDMCDAHGILVMVENRLLSSGEEDMSQLKRMIIRDRNHPCVFMLSIANEEGKLQFSETGARIAKTMHDYIKSMWDIDVTLALVFWDMVGGGLITDVYKAEKIAKYVDVTGHNYNHAIWDEFQKVYKKPFISTEQRGIPQTRGCYMSDPEKCRIGVMDTENGFFCGEGEEVWAFTAQRPYVSGLFIWTGFDYHGEPSPYDWPAISSQFGVMDLCGFEKDGFYYYKAMWREEPSIYILPHWNEIEGMNEERKVWCYTNCDEIELFINGKSVGKKKTERYKHTEFNVKYEPGEIRAAGFINNKQACSYSIRTAMRPAAVKADIQARYNENGKKYTIVTVRAADDKNVFVPDAENLICVSGAAKVIGCGNGDPMSHASETSNERKLFFGLAQFIFEGDGKVTFSAEGLKSDVICL